ncbi:MAG: MBL fold metallo-hydrolase [Acidimicrobiales bacterium]
MTNISTDTSGVSSTGQPFRSWTIGDLRVTEVVELASTSAIHFIIPEATADNLLTIPWAQPHYVNEEGRARMTIRALIIENGDTKILVDTCLGNDKERSVPVWSMRSGPFLEDLAAAGFPPDSIDYVLCTHLHVDHVGWNTRLVDGEFVPTFPNARYLFGEIEWAHWSASEDSDDVVLMGDSVRPIFDAGLVDLVATDHVLMPEVTLEPTPGHTPGHVSVRLRSAGAEAVITGDLSHHPCQLAHPDWSSSADVDRVQSEATRRAFFADNADRDVLVLGTHWEPCANRLFVDDADALTYRPEPFTG